MTYGGHVRRSDATADPDRRAEAALGFLDRLADAGLDAESGDRKALYGSLIARAELRFETYHPAAWKRPRQRFAGGSIVLTAALALIVGLLTPAQAEAGGFLQHERYEGAQPPGTTQAALEGDALADGGQISAVAGGPVSLGAELLQGSAAVGQSEADLDEGDRHRGLSA